MVTLKTLVIEALKGFRISISAPYGHPGDVLNELEHSRVKVHVSNHTGFTLRDVVVRVYASGAVKIDPIIIWGMALLDGEDSWDEMDPWDREDFVVRIKGKYDGTGYLHACVSAEVVPSGRICPAKRTIKIYPA